MSRKAGSLTRPPSFLFETPAETLAMTLHRPDTPRVRLIVLARALLRTKLVVPGPAKALLVNANFEGFAEFKNDDGSPIFKCPAEVFSTAAEAGRNLNIPVGSISKLLFGTITLEKIDEAEATLADIHSAALDDDERAFQEEMRIRAEQAREKFFGIPASDENEPALGDRQYDVLDTLYDLKAFSPDTKQTTEAVAKKLDVNAPALKEPVADLVKKKKLVDRKRGRAGGLWLNSLGKALVESQRKR